MTRQAARPGRSSDAEPFDVAVVGGGAAGLSAAVSAAGAGARVCLLNKGGAHQSTTAMAVGSITAAGTALQRRAGISDNVDVFFNDLLAAGVACTAQYSEDLLRLLACEAGTTVDWLEQLGVAFAGPFLEEPHSERRMHNVVPSARAYVDRLRAAALRSGVAVRDHSPVTGLTRSDSTGFTLTTAAGAGARSVRAGIVVLATGDFAGSDELRAQHLSPEAAAASSLNPNNTGDGLRLASSLNASLVAMDRIFGPQLRFPAPAKPPLLSRQPTWPWLCKTEASVVTKLPPSALRPIAKQLLVAHMSPSARLFEEGAVLVNQAGRRFCDEKKSVAGLALQPGGRGYLIMPLAIAERFNRPPLAISTAPGIAYAYLRDYRRARPDLVRFVADSRAVAAHLHVDEVVLRSELPSAWADSPLCVLGPVQSALTITEGGLEVDPQLRVIDRSGAPIRGLYGAGGAAQGGLLLQGHGHHMGWAMTSGRRAGLNAANTSQERPVEAST